jgi:hypothetical protein
MHINCIGNNFLHISPKTKHFTWIYNDIKSDVTFFLDENIILAFDKYSNLNGKKFGWLVESRFLNNFVKIWILQNLKICKRYFENIFTCDDDLLKRDTFFKFVPGNNTLIQNYQENKKTKRISMICSDKEYTTLQKFRKNFAFKNKQNFDLYGRNINDIICKEQGLNEYMFSVAIENDIYPNYYTEKLLDCFATKTVPIYIGSPNIDPFDEKGVIRLTKEFDFSLLTEKVYLEFQQEIEYNYNLVQKYKCLGTFIYENYLTFM